MRNTIRLFFRWSCFLLTLSAPFAEARIFRINNENFAVYFGGSYGPSQLGQSHFSGTSGTDLLIDDSVKTNQAGEFGVLFTSRYLGLRMGAELIQPPKILRAQGTDAQNQKIYDFESTVTALVPKLTLELNMTSADLWRFFLSIGGGMATATYQNKYKLTADGQAAFPGLEDYSEDGSGRAFLFDVGLGFETHMNDTTTIVLHAGYRKMDHPPYQYTKSGSGFAGLMTAGTAALNIDGTQKTSDFSGPTASLLFRFYIGK